MLSSLATFSVQLLIHPSSTRFTNCWVEKYFEALILLDGMGLDSFLQHSIPAGLEAAWSICSSACDSARYCVAKKDQVRFFFTNNRGALSVSVCFELNFATKIHRTIGHVFAFRVIIPGHLFRVTLLGFGSRFHWLGRAGSDDNM